MRISERGIETNTLNKNIDNIKMIFRSVYGDSVVLDSETQLGNIANVLGAYFYPT